MGVKVDVYVDDSKADNLSIHMIGDTLGILIGRRGETLDALQYLTSLQVNKGREGYIRVTLDTENYRAKREDSLRRLAQRMANRAVKTGRKVVLEPMNPYERRVLHTALQNHPAVTTHSEGEEPNRRVVIMLKNQPERPEKSADKPQGEKPTQPPPRPAQAGEPGGKSDCERTAGNRCRAGKPGCRRCAGRGGVILPAFFQIKRMRKIMSEQKRENGLLARGQSLIRDIVLAVFGNEALFLIVTFLYATLGDSAIVAWYREPMGLLYGYIVIPWGAALCLLRLQRRASSLEPARADVVTLFVLYLWILVPFAIRFGFTGKNVTAWHGYAVMFFGIYASISERKQREREMLMATMSVLSAVFAYVFCGALLFCAWSGTIYAADLGPFGFGAVEGWLCSGVHYNITGMIVISLCMMCVMGVGYYRNILLKLFCLIPAVMSMAVIVLTQSRTSRYALLAVLAAAAFDGVRRVLCRRNVAAGLMRAE